MRGQGLGIRRPASFLSLCGWVVNVVEFWGHDTKRFRGFISPSIFRMVVNVMFSDIEWVERGMDVSITTEEQGWLQHDCF